MDSGKLQSLYEALSVAVLRRPNIASIAKACVSSGLHPHEMLDYWKNSDADFANFIDKRIAARFSLAYCEKWTPKYFLSYMHSEEVSRACELFHYSKFTDDHGDFVRDDQEDRFVAMALVALLCHGPKTTALPRNAVSDRYCLWAIFKEAFPRSADTFVEESETKATGSKRRAAHPSVSRPVERACKKGSSDGGKLDRLIDNTDQMMDMLRDLCAKNTSSDNNRSSACGSL